MEVEIDVDQLYEDLLEHFGSMTALAEEPASWDVDAAENIMSNALPEYEYEIHKAVSRIPRSSITHGFVNGALGKIESMYRRENWQGLADLAQHEGFDMTAYMV